MILDFINRFSPTIKTLFRFAKAIAYGGLAIMLYSNFIGPEGIAELLKIQNPKKEGLDTVALLIPKYVLVWTIVTVVLEFLGNFCSFQNMYELEKKYLTKKEFYEWELREASRRLNSIRKK